MTIDIPASHQVIDISLGWLNWISLFASAISIVLGIIAIWLSIVFYKMSDKSSDNVRLSTEKIDSNVSKLEKIFDTMYSDTFNMVKDNVVFMKEQVDKSYVMLNGNTKTSMDQDIEEHIKQLVEDKVSSIELKQIDAEGLKETILQTINSANEMKKNLVNDNLNHIIIDTIKSNPKITYEELQKRMENKGFMGIEIFNAVIELVNIGVIRKDILTIDLDGPDEYGIYNNTPITLTGRSI